MVRSKCDEDGQHVKTDRVSLTVGNWVGIVGLLGVFVSCIVVPMLSLQYRLTTVENKTEYSATRIGKIEDSMQATRGEILGEIRELRNDIKRAK